MKDIDTFSLCIGQKNLGTLTNTMFSILPFAANCSIFVWMAFRMGATQLHFLEVCSNFFLFMIMIVCKYGESHLQYESVQSAQQCRSTHTNRSFNTKRTFTTRRQLLPKKTKSYFKFLDFRLLGCNWQFAKHHNPPWNEWIQRQFNHSLIIVSASPLTRHKACDRHVISNARL